jgi:hypothetical protein
MSSIVRLVGAAGLLAVLACGAAAPAGADTGAGYQLAAHGQGLQITLAGTTLVGGTSSASAASSAPTTAAGNGVVTPAVTETAQASVDKPGATQNVPQGCAQPAAPFPAPLGSLVSLGVACASANAMQDTNGLVSATGTGEVASLTVAPSSGALSTLVTPGSPLAGALGQLFGSLPPLPSGGSPLGSVLGSVAQAASAQLTYLVKVAVGSSSSSVHATPSTATADTQDAGVTVSLLGGMGVKGGPLATVVIGSASTTSTLDRATSTVKTADTPAAVTIDVTPPAGTPVHQQLAPGASQTILAGTPLETTIAAGDGTADATPGSSQGSASAEGVEVEALTGVGATDAARTNGGVGVNVAGSSTSATVDAAPVTPTTTPPAAPLPAHATAATVPGVTTVHTGEFWAGPLPIALGALAMLSSLLLLRRPRAEDRHLWRLARRAPRLPDCGTATPSTRGRSTP